MPTANPRITVTIRPSIHALLRRMAELTGESQSGLIGDLLDKSAPIFERMVRVLEAAEKLRTEGKSMGEEFTQGLEHAQARVEQQLGLVLESLETHEGALLGAAEAISRRGGRPRSGAPRRAEGGRGAAPTPISNRGVTPRVNPHPKGPAGKKTAAKKSRGGKQ